MSAAHAHEPMCLLMQWLCHTVDMYEWSRPVYTPAHEDGQYKGIHVHLCNEDIKIDETVAVADKQKKIKKELAAARALTLIALSGYELWADTSVALQMAADARPAEPDPAQTAVQPESARQAGMAKPARKPGRSRKAAGGTKTDLPAQAQAKSSVPADVKQPEQLRARVTLLEGADRTTPTQQPDAPVLNPPAATYMLAGLSSSSDAVL